MILEARSRASGPLASVVVFPDASHTWIKVLIQRPLVMRVMSANANENESRTRSERSSKQIVRFPEVASGQRPVKNPKALFVDHSCRGRSFALCFFLWISTCGET